MASNRVVPAAPTVGDAIRNLGGEAPPESTQAPEELAPETGQLAAAPVPLAAVESVTGQRSGGWDSAADEVAAPASSRDPLVDTETVFVPVAPPDPVSPPSHIAFAPASTTPDAASHRVADGPTSDPTPYMPSTGASRVPTQSVQAGLAAMGLELPEPIYAEPDYEDELPTPVIEPVVSAAQPQVFPAAPPLTEPAYTDPGDRTPAPVPQALPPAAPVAAVVPAAPVPAPRAPLAPESDPIFAEPEPAGPQYDLPPLSPSGVYVPAPPVASVLPGAGKQVPAHPLERATTVAPVAVAPVAPPPARPPGYEYEPEAYADVDPREAVRSATRRAVDRLTRPVPESATAPVSERQLPRIVEFTQQVERAVIGAAAAERFQREIEQTAREAAADVISTAAAEAQRSLESATAESHSVVAGAAAEADKLLSDAQAERDAIIARAESQAKATLAQADIELDRRLRRIAALTDEIVDIAEAAAGQTAAGTMHGPQIAHFIGALGTVTDRALEQLELGSQATTIPTPHATDEQDVSGEDETES